MNVVNSNKNALKVNGSDKYWPQNVSHEGVIIWHYAPLIILPTAAHSDP